MADHPNRATATELAVLKALWRGGPGTVRELDVRLREEGKDWAYTTLQTLLSRLEAKQLVAVDRTPFAHVYSAAVTRDGFLSGRLTQLADEVCDGTSMPLVMALVENSKFSRKDIERFRRLLDELDAGQRKRRTRRSTKERDRD